MTTEMYILIAVLIIVAFWAMRKIRKINTYLLRWGVIFIIILMIVQSQENQTEMEPEPDFSSVEGGGLPLILPPDAMFKAGSDLQIPVDPFLRPDLHNYTSWDFWVYEQWLAFMNETEQVA